jgi:hypothetical protein
MNAQNRESKHIYERITLTNSSSSTFFYKEEEEEEASQVTIYTNFDGLEIQSQEQSSPPQTTIWANIVFFFIK